MLLQEVNVVGPVLISNSNNFLLVMLLMSQANLNSIREVYLLVEIDNVAREGVNSALSKPLHALLEGLF
jgi:hypothetical protein